MSQGQVSQDRLARGLRAQMQRRRKVLAVGAAPVGWKIGFNLAAVQERLGLEAPVIGFLTSEGLLEPDATHPAGGLAECEVAIHLGADVEPGATREEAIAAVAALGPAIEVADIPDLELGIETILEGNVFHRAVAFGEPVPGATLAGVTARVLLDGEARGSCDALAATGDPAAIVAHVAELAGVAGERLRAGERIIAGAMPPLLVPEPGQRVELDLGPLGSVALGFS